VFLVIFGYQNFVKQYLNYLLMNDKIKATLVIGISIILTGFLLGKAFKNRNANLDAISVIGLGTTDFVSDEILWTGNFTTISFDIKTAYNKIVSDQKIIAAFFIKKGFKSNEFSFSAISFQKKFREIRKQNLNNQTEYEQIFDGYIASQTVSFVSRKNKKLMLKIENVASKTSELINSGIELSSNTIQYTFSDLPSLKQTIIENATKDANQRAGKIVNTANGKLGKLKNASMGVFQITGQGSTEDDSYGGIYDIYSKNKTARITVRLEYQLE